MENEFEEYNGYSDRGMMKWGGFVLSEHSQLNEEEEKRRNRDYPPKPMMTEEEIQAVLFSAIQKNKPVSIQTTKIDKNGRHSPDCVGLVLGGDGNFLSVGSERIDFYEIRHIALLNREKWWKDAL